MATDDEASPHRLAPQMKARILVAGADEDRSFDEAQCERLADALQDAGLEADVSIWKGLKHGWVPSSAPTPRSVRAPSFPQSWTFSRRMRWPRPQVSRSTQASPVWLGKSGHRSASR